MTFNINRFKSKMDSYGGPALTSLFVVEFYGTNSEFVDAESLRFFCKSVTVPGINFVTYDYNPRNFGMSESMPTGIASAQMNAVFMLDSQHRIMSFFHEWMLNINNYNAADGFSTPNPRSPNQLPYEMNYKEDYAVSCSVRQFSTNSNEIEYQTYDCDLRGVFPTEVSGATAAWESNEPASMSVNFSFNKIKHTRRNQDSIITSPIPPAPRSPVNRDGLVEYATVIGDATSSLQSFVDRQSRINPFSSILSINRR
jgi:hypothetical protein